MSREAPQMRAGHVLKNIESAACHGPEAVARLRAEIPPAILREVEHAMRLTWLPLRHDIDIYRISNRLFGPKATRERVRNALRDTLDGPLLKPVLDGAVRMFGLDPGSFFRLTPTAWSGIYRHTGGVAHEPGGPDGSAIVVTDAASELLEAPDYLQGIADALCAVLDVCKVEGGVEVGKIDPQARLVRFDVRWRRAR